MSFPEEFSAYLREPCDFCTNTATSNQAGHKVCNAHIQDNIRSFCRDD